MTLPSGYLSKEQRRLFIENANKCRTPWMAVEWLESHADACDTLLAERDREIASLKESNNSVNQYWCATEDEWVTELAAKDARLKECAETGANILEMMDHVEFPARCHEGACGPEAGCDGVCMELASMGQIVRTFRMALAKLEAAGISK